jgi:stage III sporulation protein AG
VNKLNDKKTKGLLSRLKAEVKPWMFAALALVGVVLLIFGGSEKKETPTSADNGSDLVKYSKEVEAKILELCSKVEGVRNVSVAVSFESGFEYVYATDGDKTLTVGSGSNESAVRVTEKPPTISGVGIVCTGGGDPRIQQKLINLISAAYGISSNKIYITEAQK